MASTISSTLTSAVVLSSAGQNPLTITTGGAIATSAGVAITGDNTQAWSVANAGLIRNGPVSGIHPNAGILLQAGGTVTNTGSIISYGIGVQIDSDAGTVTNSAAIIGSGIGVALYGGGSVTNLAGGTISGAAFLGVNIVHGDGTVTNAGTIIGSSTDAVLFEGDYNDRLIVDPGAVFLGGRAANGGFGSNTLELAVGNASAGTLSGLGTSYVGFQTAQVDPGATWTLASSNAVHGNSTLELLGGNGAETLPTMQSAPGAAVTNAGYLANAGSILVMGGDNPVGETYGGYGGTLTNAGTLSNTGLLSLAGSNPIYELSRGIWDESRGVLYDTGTLTNAGTINVAAGSASNSYHQIGGLGARLSVSGALINTGTLNVYGGNTGLAAARTVTDSFGGIVQIVATGTVTNAGTLNLTAVTPGFEGSTLANAVFGAELLDRGVLINNGALLVAGYGSGSDASTDALLEIATAGSLTNTGSITGAGVLRNYGLLSGGGSTTGSISVATLLNDHIIASGTGGGLSINGAITADTGNTGLIEIAAGGSLTLNGAIDASQTVVFEGVTGTLSLGDPMGFAGTIVGMVPGDQLDLTGLPYDAAGSAMWTNGTLLVTSGSIAVNIDVSEAPPGSIVYRPSQDAGSGTFLNPSPPGPVTITEVGIPGDSPESVSGTADPYGTISVEIGTITVGTTTANAAGDWTLAVPSQLAYGTDLDVIASEQGGQTSQPVLLSYHLPLVIDQVGTPGGSPESVSGTADPDSTVTVAIGGESVGTATADAAGDWTFAGPTILVDGTDLSVIASEDGLQSAPVLLSYLPLFITQVGTPGSPESVSGTALPNATVSVTIGGVEIGTTTANAAGDWTVAGPSPLIYGIGLSVIASEDGFSSTPVLLTALPLAINQVGTPGGNPESMSGTADPNSSVTIMIGGVSVGTVTADEAGDWTFAGPSQLVYGNNLSVIASANGLQSAEYLLTYPPFAINQVGTPDGSPESVSGTALPDTTVAISIGGVQVGTVIADAAGDWTLTGPTQLVYGTAMRVVATAGDQTSAPVLLTYHNILEITQESITAGEVIIDGTADPSETVFVTLDGSIAARPAFADTNGDWTVDLGPLNPGIHAVVASVTDRGAAPSESSPQDFTTLCFCAGTRIATPDGTVPVEQLAVGDMVLTASGAIRPIVWIGIGHALTVRGQRGPATPVIVRKGALADNVPHTDLRVTKGHSLFIDNVLIPVELLVNHRSIQWDDRSHAVTIYHIELQSHDVLLANGAPAESYRDDGNRRMFQNANAGWDLPPERPCAPVQSGGAIVQAVWSRLADRAGKRPDQTLTEDPDVHLLVDGRRIDGVMRGDGYLVFELQRIGKEHRVVSRAGSPAELGLAPEPRVLGVAIRRIVLWQAALVRLIEATDPALTDGFHGFEADNGFRWTNGNALLPAELFCGLTGPCQVELKLGCTTHYPLLTTAA